MHKGRHELIAAYARGPEALRLALSAVAPQRRAVRPAPSKWSVREIALHLCDSELSAVFRMKRAIAEPGRAVPAFDQDRWTAALAPLQDLDSALRAFAALRAEMVAILRQLPEAAWDQVAVHESAGPLTLAQYLERTVRHTDTHLAQIHALARRGGPEPAPDRP